MARLEEDEKKRTNLLQSAIKSIERYLTLLEKDGGKSTQEWVAIKRGNQYFQIARILYKIFSMSKEYNLLTKAIVIIDKAILTYNEINHFSNLAESYWQKAKIQDQQKEYLMAANNFDLASKAFTKASEKLSNLKNYYINHSRYMNAWNRIVQAKYHHSREEYAQAAKNYEDAGSLHQELDDWNDLSSNYFAWSKIEQAEESSRKEKPQEAIYKFEDANGYFLETENNIKNRITGNLTTEETDLITEILKSSVLRQKYCQARILMEDAKLLDREGNYLDSSKSYEKAVQNFSEIINKIEIETDRKELEYIRTLCKAWGKMASAEERSSSELYLEAAELFEKAKEYSYTKKASLWALGNSNFCRGLAAGINYQTMLDLNEHSKAKRFIKSAATNYLSAGFKNASEYAKGTQRLFDAYIYINKAESEPDQRARKNLESTRDTN
ncbi:MAG: hypothetical protein P8Y18_12155 [Candidatus Bathyarchaeota archaeon]